MKLYIDTRSRENIIISILKNGEVFYSTQSDSHDVTPESALALIEGALNDSSIKTSELKEIFVEVGPGSYTGVRVGVSIANSLSFALGIPVNKKSISDIALPEY